MLIVIPVINWETVKSMAKYFNLNLEKVKALKQNRLDYAVYREVLLAADKTVEPYANLYITFAIGTDYCNDVTILYKYGQVTGKYLCTMSILRARDFVVEILTSECTSINECSAVGFSIGFREQVVNLFNWLVSMDKSLFTGFRFRDGALLRKTGLC